MRVRLSMSRIQGRNEARTHCVGFAFFLQGQKPLVAMVEPGPVPFSLSCKPSAATFASPLTDTLSAGWPGLTLIARA
jgi:hypothetical protein